MPVYPSRSGLNCFLSFTMHRQGVLTTIGKRWPSLFSSDFKSITIEPPPGIEPSYPDYKSGASPAMLKRLLGRRKMVQWTTSFMIGITTMISNSNIPPPSSGYSISFPNRPNYLYCFFLKSFQLF